MKAVLQGIVDRVNGEPVLTLGLFQALIAMAVGFGLEWTGDQVALTTMFSAAVLSWIARSRVSPAA